MPSRQKNPRPVAEGSSKVWLLRVSQCLGLSDCLLLGSGKALPHRSGAPAGEVAFLTGPMTEPQLRKRLEGLEVRSLFRVLA